MALGPDGMRLLWLGRAFAVPFDPGRAAGHQVQPAPLSLVVPGFSLPEGLWSYAREQSRSLGCTGEGQR